MSELGDVALWRAILADVKGNWRSIWRGHEATED